MPIEDWDQRDGQPEIHPTLSWELAGGRSFGFLRILYADQPIADQKSIQLSMTKAQLRELAGNLQRIVQLMEASGPATRQ